MSETLNADLALCSMDDLTRELLDRHHARGLAFISVMELPHDHEGFKSDSADSRMSLCGHGRSLAKLGLGVVDILEDECPGFKKLMLTKLINDEP